MRIYTKTGDRGETALHSGRRVPKDDPLLHIYGTVDELNAILGLCLAEHPKEPSIESRIARIQNELFDLGADLSAPYPDTKVTRLSEGKATALEKEIDEMEKVLTPLKEFILPGGGRLAALLHLARTVCRRAERHATPLFRQEKLNPHAYTYLNRLSDWLFVMARFANRSEKVPDIPWKQSR